MASVETILDFSLVVRLKWPTLVVVAASTDNAIAAFPVLLFEGTHFLRTLISPLSATDGCFVLELGMLRVPLMEHVSLTMQASCKIYQKTFNL